MFGDWKTLNNVIIAILAVHKLICLIRISPFSRSTSSQEATYGNFICFFSFISFLSIHLLLLLIFSSSSFSFSFSYESHLLHVCLSQVTDPYRFLFILFPVNISQWKQCDDTTIRACERQLMTLKYSIWITKLFEIDKTGKASHLLSMLYMCYWLSYMYCVYILATEWYCRTAFKGYSATVSR